MSKRNPSCRLPLTNSERRGGWIPFSKGTTDEAQGNDGHINRYLSLLVML